MLLKTNALQLIQCFRGRALEGEPLRVIGQQPHGLCEGEQRRLPAGKVVLNMLPYLVVAVFHFDSGADTGADRKIALLLQPLVCETDCVR